MEREFTFSVKEIIMKEILKRVNFMVKGFISN